jgi:hypothetical protein
VVRNDTRTKEDAMRKRMMIALFLATAAVGPAAAQPSDNARGGIPTETQSRLATSTDYNILWDLLGLFGLLGLLGLRKEHPDDGYHPAPVE